MPLLPRPLADVVDRGIELAVVPSFSRVGSVLRRHVLDDWTPIQDLPGNGRTVVVTGANSGLGYATALGLVRAGAAVRLVVRSDEKGERTLARLLADSGREQLDAGYHVADLTDLDRVRDVAAEIAEAAPELHAVVHNAGAMFDERRETEDGIERTLALHVIGPQVLTAGLLDALAAARGRVVWVASGGMYAQRLSVRHLQSERDYKPATAYARAKRAQVTLAGEWQSRIGRYRDVTFHAMHPGWAETPGVASAMPVFHTVMGPLLRSPEDGADTAVWLCLANEPLERAGRFWLDRRPRDEHKLPTTEHEQSEADALWGYVNDLAGVDATGLAIPA